MTSKNKISGTHINAYKRKIDYSVILIIFQMIFTTIALIHAWTLQYKARDGSANFISRISFTSEDPPWTPPGTFSHPILHLHHFGDWTLGLAYGQYKNPYDPHLAIPSVIPPLGIQIMKIFSLVGERLSFLILCALTLILWTRVCKHYLVAFSAVEKLAIGLLFIAFSLPSINSFDRGAVHLVLMAMIALSLIEYENKNYLRALILIGIVISFKPYTISLTLWLLRKREFRQLLTSWLVIVLTNIIALLFINTNVIEGAKQYLTATSQYTRAFITPWAMDSASLVGFISKTVEGFNNSKEAEKVVRQILPWSLLIGALYVTVVIVIIMKDRIPQTFSKIILISTCSIVAPPSLEYTLVWASLAAIWLIVEGRKIANLKEVPKLDWRESVMWGLLGSSVIVLVTPYFGLLQMPSGVNRHQPGSYLYIPMTVLATIFGLIFSLQKKHLNLMEKNLR